MVFVLTLKVGSLVWAIFTTAEVCEQMDVVAARCQTSTVG